MEALFSVSPAFERRICDFNSNHGRVDPRTLAEGGVDAKLGLIDPDYFEDKLLTVLRSSLSPCIQ